MMQAYESLSAGRPVILTGMPASGKSLVGGALAALLGYDFLDTDALVAAAAGKSIAAIFAGEGEAGFRAREREAVIAALTRRRTVIALGGGAFCSPFLRRRISEAGTSVWLKASLPVLAARLKSQSAAQDERPLLTGRPRALALQALARKRHPAYARADYMLITDSSSPKTLAGEIKAQLLAR